MSTRRVTGALAGRIADVALEHFCADGFDGTSIRDIAADLEVTPAALYYHYRSKDEILEAILEPLVCDLEAYIHQADQHPPTNDAERCDYLEQLLEVLLRQPDLLRLVLNDVSVATHPGVRARLGDVPRRLPELLVARDVTPQERIRAAAAIGALLRPLIILDDDDLASHTSEVLDASIRALGIPERS
jgi:AcrR family transcriptional regulator